ncbi:flagellar brake protein [Vibrio aestuarianus]|uniref:Flagellar brake protein n=1 Tax=Vibrio aestuarianus TaxID=28171 RepID=A0A7X6NCG9_9VIBR|nr:flagellar brake protein [Vibrio aestuarianus]KOE80608.1 cation tolerance protein CutA [Vibrio alginolyticus]MDE1208929.1 flagellar brake protein [Vibrio aestuarianus]MDE1222182.1 flagellar brake protein [Vibrio aestuarianus]MDE1224277.1 flagellar brake protein [Vibrio aestuarianus]MDE1238930.1 flagellar brake protein [Vibrio aestuarianus]
MNSQSAVLKGEQSPNRTTERNKTLSTLNSTDALSMVEHGSELTLSITTPVGTKFICKTPFIGTHSNTYILIEIPKISADDLAFFFQEGFWVNVRAISPRGEGAMIHFRSQLMNILQEPVPLAMLSIPNTMQVTQLRKEARYDVNLVGKAIVGTHKSDCEVRDLSKSGCRFVAPPLGRTFQVGDKISIELFADSRGSKVFAPLVGKVCNLQRSLHYARYGIQFDEEGVKNAKNLLGQLKFDGTKLTLK